MLLVSQGKSQLIVLPSWLEGALGGLRVRLLDLLPYLRDPFTSEGQAAIICQSSPPRKNPVLRSGRQLGGRRNDTLRG